MAKEATIVPIRVLDCKAAGSWSSVIAGLDWMIEDHDVGEPAVANLSISGAASQSVDKAIARTISDGITVTVAAGNSGTDACKSSPARAPEALTVGAIQSDDQRASFSNYGSCLDMFAPGVDIMSDWNDGMAYALSSTSMAAPHVAGAAALILSPALSCRGRVAGS